MLKSRSSRLFGFTHILGLSWELQAWNSGASEAARADVVVEPDTGEHPGFDFDRFEEMVGAGRQAAEDRLDAIQAAIRESLKPENS